MLARSIGIVEQLHIPLMRMAMVVDPMRTGKSSSLLRVSIRPDMSHTVELTDEDHGNGCNASAGCLIVHWGRGGLVDDGDNRELRFPVSDHLYRPRIRQLTQIDMRMAEIQRVGFLFHISEKKRI